MPTEPVMPTWPVRPMTIGRKNWLFVGSKDGGEGAATIYSLLQTCRRLNIEPQTYLTDVLRRLPYTTEENLNQLLPHLWKANPHKKSERYAGKLCMGEKH